MLLLVGGLASQPKEAEPVPASAGRYDRTLPYGGVSRTYRLHLPRDFSPKTPVPLVVVLHGMFANGPMTEQLTRFSLLADQKGFAVVYPDGRNRLWRYWEKEDPAFVMAVVDRLVQEKIADAERVYMCGISNGAYLTSILACDYADRIAAAAGVAGTMPKLASERAAPSRPMPFLYIHGTADTIVGYDGKDRFSNMALSLPADDFVRWWARKNHCGDTPVVEKLPDRAEDDTTVERHAFRPARGGAEVVLYKVVGGGHTWPGGGFHPEFLLGKVCKDFNASETMWDFFARHRLTPKK
jgi:polyhydroxybutyrate depolymerase